MSSEEISECLPLESMARVGSFFATPAALGNRSQRRKQDASIVTGKSLCTDFLCSQTFDSDEFQTEVTVKTRTEMLMQSEAEREVVVDHLIQQEETEEKALFYVLKTRTSSEPNILLMVSALLARRANPSCREDNDGQRSPLHHASEKGFVDVVKELLSKGARPDIRDKDGKMPVHIAVSIHNDDIAALLVLQMDNKTVRGLFTVPDNSDEAVAQAEISLHKLIESGKMKKTVEAVLSCMTDPLGNSSSVRVYFHALDADRNGRSPKHPRFDTTSKSCIHLMSLGQHADFVYHDVVRLSLKRKWTEFARRSFMLNMAIFVASEVMLCVGAVLASTSSDPTDHTEPRQIVRAVAEYLFLIDVIRTFALEVLQIKKHRMDYFKDKFNLLGLVSSIFLLLVIPFRILRLSQQWPIYSVGFLLWTLRIFNFAAVFRDLGVYSQVLWRILLRDFPQFIGVFAIILVAFSGSFVLALRGEDSLGVHKETSNFWEIMFTGVRILVEGQPVLEYYGPDGYRGFSCFLMVTFLGMSCVVLLSILIAQLSDTYQNVQSDARRRLQLNRAWIITRVELHSVYHKYRTPHRMSKYIHFEDITNPKEVLKKWDSPPMSEINRHVKDIKEMDESHSLKLRQISIRMKHLEEQNIQILTLLRNLGCPSSPSAESGSEIQTENPDMARSASESEVSVFVEGST